MRLCTRSELEAAFRMVAASDEAETLANDFFRLHNLDTAGSPDVLLWDPADFGRITENEAVKQGLIVSRGPLQRRTPLLSSVRSLPANLRRQALLAFSSFTLDLLGAVSPELAQRINELTGASAQEIQSRREQAFGTS